ncbi:MAG: 2-hydroxyacid dehydrogenase [Patescibacteria group bacterium]
MAFKKALLIGISQGSLDQEYWDRLDALADRIVHVAVDDPSIAQELKDTDCLLLGFNANADQAVIDAAPDLKYIGVQATAFNRIDIEHAKTKNIPVCNLGGYSTESVAEFVIASLLEVIRGLEEGKQRGRSGNYSEDGMSARELKGSEFGVIGLGNIGSRVAELAAGFGANVSYWSHSAKNVPFTCKDLDELITSSDFLSLNPALSPDTENLLNAARINSLKAGAVVINTCPMELVDIEALAERLAKNDITFVLDHSDDMSEEDLATLGQYKNCIIYPPIAYISDGARRNKGEIFTGNIAAALQGKPTNQVNK